MATVTVLLFARARELAGKKQLDNFDVKGPATVRAFIDGIIELVPALSDIMESCGVAVNQEYVDEDHALQVSAALHESVGRLLARSDVDFASNSCLPFKHQNHVQWQCGEGWRRSGTHPSHQRRIGIRINSYISL